MHAALLIFGLIIGLLSFVGIFRPKWISGMATGFAARPIGYPFAVFIRLVLGSVLVFGAPLTPYPTVIFVIGVIAFIAAFVILLMGRDRFARMVAWIASAPDSLMRVAGIFGAVFGGFLAYAAAA